MYYTYYVVKNVNKVDTPKIIKIKKIIKRLSRDVLSSQALCKFIA